MRETTILLFLALNLAFAQEVGEEELDNSKPVIRLFKGKKEDFQSHTKTKVLEIKDQKRIRDIAFVKSGLENFTNSLDPLDKNIFFNRAKTLNINQMKKFYPEVSQENLKVFLDEVKKEMP